MGARQRMAMQDAGWAFQPVFMHSFAFSHCLAGTSGPSQLLSSWVGKEPSGSPPVGTAATSPSPLGSSGGTLRPVPSTPFPDFRGQPQSSPQTSSSEAIANDVMLHSRNVMGNSTSPSRTASPATESTFGGELCWPTDLVYTFKKPLYSFYVLETEKMLCFAYILSVIIWMVS